MSVRRQQLLYGTLWGTVAFLVGAIATYLVAPTDLLDTERWRAAAWLFLSANGVPVAGIRVAGLSGLGTNVNLIEATGRLRALYALPPLLVTLAAVLTADSLPYTNRPKYLALNATSAVIGYVGAALGVILVSGARPSVAVVLLLAGLLGGGLFLGSTVANRLTGGLPVFGVATLGGLALIGLAIIVGGVTVASALAPLAGIGLGGAAVATLLLRTVRSL
jgi:hypothetical protein